LSRSEDDLPRSPPWDRLWETEDADEALERQQRTARIELTRGPTAMPGVLAAPARRDAPQNSGFRVILSSSAAATTKHPRSSAFSATRLRSRLAGIALDDQHSQFGGARSTTLSIRALHVSARRTESSRQAACVEVCRGGETDAVRHAEHLGIGAVDSVAGFIGSPARAAGFGDEEDSARRLIHRRCGRVPNSGMPLT